MSRNRRAAAFASRAERDGPGFSHALPGNQVNVPHEEVLIMAFRRRQPVYETQGPVYPRSDEHHDADTRLEPGRVR